MTGEFALIEYDDLGEPEYYGYELPDTPGTPAVIRLDNSGCIVSITEQ